MKRYCHLFQQVCSFETLAISALNAAKGKKTKPRVADFLYNLENEIIDLKQEIGGKAYEPLPYRTFMA